MPDPTNRKKILIRTMLKGALIGTCFPVFSYLFRDRPNLLFLVICTAPLVLALCAYLVARNRMQAEEILVNKRSEKKINEQKNLLETILNNLPNMVFAKDFRNDLRFVLFNSAGESLLGLKNQDLIGKNDYDLFPKEQADFFIEKDREVFRTGQKLVIEHEPIDTPKGKRILKTVKVPTFQSDGSPNLLIGISTDITEELELQKSLEQERSRSLLHSKLASLGEMSAGVAHEINNPLAIISGSLGLLRRYRENPEKFEAKLISAEKSTERIARIVRGLKKFARSSDEPRLVALPVEEIIRESVSFTETRAQQNQTRIEVDIRTGSKILCDSVEIEQVMINLINNGIDAAKGGTAPWLRIEAYDESEEVVIRVLDSGSGVSAEVEERLFEPFFTTKEIGEGTGLGLSISKGIIAQHKASLFLNRNLPNTCFELRFKKHDAS
ncbi:MAG: PAS domain-containing protein [Bdellovibrionales bacterium]|nr:PAS domain-containing protein [Bdellovibrionales bacterium]